MDGDILFRALRWRVIYLLFRTFRWMARLGYLDGESVILIRAFRWKVRYCPGISDGRYDNVRVIHLENMILITGVSRLRAMSIRQITT